MCHSSRDSAQIVESLLKRELDDRQPSGGQQIVELPKRWRSAALGGRGNYGGNSKVQTS